MQKITYLFIKRINFPTTTENLHRNAVYWNLKNLENESEKNLLNLPFSSSQFTVENTFSTKSWSKVEVVFDLNFIEMSYKFETMANSVLCQTVDNICQLVFFACLKYFNLFGHFLEIGSIKIRGERHCFSTHLYWLQF